MTDGWQWTIQLYEHYPTEPEAQAALTTAMLQDGALVGRVLAPCAQIDRTDWRVQCLYETNGDAPHGWLPDGLRHVMVRVRGGKVVL